MVIVKFLADFVYLIQKPSRRQLTVLYLGLRWDNYLTAESNKRNPQDRTLELSFFVHHKHMTSLKNNFRLHKARVCSTGSGQLLWPCLF